MTEPAIETSRLSRNFGAVVAISDLDLHVPQGVFYGLIGPNGAGKSTTLRMLLGLLQPSAGSIKVFGKNPVAEGDLIRRLIGVVLEPCGLYERMSALNNLDYHGRMWRMTSLDRKTRAKEMLTVMGLWDRRDEIITEWGRGLKQRLCIARSLFHRPKLVLLDEPYAGLDPEAIDEVSSYLCDLTTKTGVTIVMATNNLAVADAYCHRITLLKQGRAVASGRTDEIRTIGSPPTMHIAGRGFSDDVVALLLRRPEVVSASCDERQLDLRLAAQVDTAPLVSLLIESGVSITEVRKSQASLKSAFDVLLRQEPQEMV